MIYVLETIKKLDIFEEVFETKEEAIIMGQSYMASNDPYTSAIVFSVSKSIYEQRLNSDDVMPYGDLDNVDVHVIQESK